MTDHVDDLIASYALGAVDDRERLVVEAHVASCADCTRELSEMASVIDALPLSAEPFRPSPALKARVLNRAGQDLERESRPAPLQPSRYRERGRFWMRAPALGLAAAVAALIAGVAVGRSIGTPTLTAHQRYVQLLGTFVTHGDRVIHFRPTQPHNTLDASLVVPPSGRASIVVGSLPSLSASRVYQVWFMSNPASPRSAAVFAMPSTFPERVGLRLGARGYRIAAVTVEPGPHGSSRPTSKPVISAPITSA